MLTSLARAVAGFAAMPLVLTLLLAAAGLALRHRGRWLLLCAAMLAYLAAIPAVGDGLLGSLEHRYPPLDARQPLPAADFVVVLGSGFSPHDGVPITAALDQDGLVRVVEGVRLARHPQIRKLILSGGAPAGQPAPARGYAELARDLGMEESRLISVATPQDTAAEAREIARLLGEQPFILVTSAYHMPRAMRLMARAGAHAIAAPTGQLTGGAQSNSWRQWLPDSGGLAKCERALHEYLGLAALELGLI